MRCKGSIRVPCYLVPVARKIRQLERALERGMVIQAPGVWRELQPDGRMQLRAVAGIGPGAARGVAAVTFDILLETGDYLLLESGDKIRLES